MTAPFISIHGRRMGLTPYGLLVDGRVMNSGPSGMGRGNTIYVSSAVNGGDGTSPATALGTLDAAFAKCTANNGDVIIVMPAHAETITAASAIAHDVAGVSVIGLGYGNQRPTITYGTANTATYVVSAAGAYISNIIFRANFLAVATAIGITAVDCWLDGLSFKNAGTSKNFTNPINVTTTTDNAADSLRVVNCRWFTGSDTAGGAFIKIASTIEGAVIQNNFVVTASTATAQMVSVATGKLLTAADIGWNRLVNLMTSGELFISNDGTTNTGIIHNNYSGHADVTGTHDPGWDAGGFRLFNNLSTSVDNLQGVVVPAIDVNL